MVLALPFGDTALRSCSPFWCIDPAKSSGNSPEWCVGFSATLRNSADMLAKRVSENIRRVRKARGLSLERVAEKCVPKTSYQQISRLEENGRRLTLDWVERIGHAMSVDPIELITGQNAAGRPAGLSEQVANEVARTLARVALGGEEPDDGTLQVLSLMLQELSETFSAHPQAFRDPEIARPVLALASRRSGHVAN
jgi:transcriptional regulator with XRE-family HTH domain